MKSDFMLAITQLSAEKNLPKEVVIKAVESALASAYRKDNFAPNQNITAKIDPATGRVGVWAEKTVVEVLVDNRREMLLEEARRIKLDVKLGDPVWVEATPQNAGRIAAQMAKQVILQRLHEAEHSAIFEEYADKEGDIIVGIVQHTSPQQVLLDLGRTEAVLPAPEQVRTERYRVGQRLKVYLLEIARTLKGSRVIVSRSHPNLTRRLFELEVPEVLSGVVEIKAVTREAGYRSKIAVAARQPGIDPVGCCVGLRGIRIQNIVNELNGEKIDVVAWDPDPPVFIANALSPAKVLSVKLNDREGVAAVVVPDRQLSLAIGKEGQNARLAAKLTGWRIDIKSATMAEAEKAAEVKPVAAAEPPSAVVTTSAAEAVPQEPIKVPVLAAVPEEIGVAAGPTTEAVAEAPEVAPEETLVPLTFAPKTAEKRLRFAEDILSSASPKPGVKAKDKKKRTGKEREEEGVRGRKLQAKDIQIEEEEEF